MGTYIGIGACLLIGSLMLLYAAKSLYETIVFMRGAAKTVGTVIRLDNSRNSDGNTMYLPVFEYRTNDGSVYQHTSKVASSPPSYNVGDTATILYHKRNPRNARVKSFVEMWLVKVVFATIGFSCYIAALFILLGVS